MDWLEYKWSASNIASTSYSTIIRLTTLFSLWGTAAVYQSVLLRRPRTRGNSTKQWFNHFIIYIYIYGQRKVSGEMYCSINLQPQILHWNHVIYNVQDNNCGARLLLSISIMDNIKRPRCLIYLP